jgi:hypothetical protein
MFTHAVIRPQSSDLIGGPATRAALALLLGGLHCAEFLERSKWEFACGLPYLRELGLTDEVLRDLMVGGYLEKRQERIPPTGTRAWPAANEPPASLVPPLIALTHAGAALAWQSVCGGRAESLLRPDRERTREDGPPPAVPVWKAAVRELWFAGRAVKRYHRAAPNQERILVTFQELKWRDRIDDPLPKEAGMPAPERLRETVKSLNRGVERGTLLFRAEADGQGVCWAPLAFGPVRPLASVNSR